MGRMSGLGSVGGVWGRVLGLGLAVVLVVGLLPLVPVGVEGQTRTISFRITDRNNNPVSAVTENAGDLRLRLHMDISPAAHKGGSVYFNTGGSATRHTDYGFGYADQCCISAGNWYSHVQDNSWLSWGTGDTHKSVDFTLRMVDDRLFEYYESFKIVRGTATDGFTYANSEVGLSVIDQDRRLGVSYSVSEVGGECGGAVAVGYGDVE